MDHPAPGPYLGSLIPYEKTNDKIQDLIKSALEARLKAYAPYSRFSVGAALLCENGDIIQGCNVENICTGLSVCAEQTALVKAISSGQNKFKAMAVVGDSQSSITTPCGRCRQFIVEFGKDIEIYCAKADMKEVLLTTISKLLPFSFKPLLIRKEKNKQEPVISPVRMHQPKFY